MSSVTAEQFSMRNLGELYTRTPQRELNDSDRIVIFSDLHMGNGSRTDDFVHNADLFSQVLEQYYAAQGFHLILNGDVEELQRFSLRSVVHRWKRVYQALGKVAEKGGLTRIVGNHDIDLLEGGPSVSPLVTADRERWPQTYTAKVEEALRLQYRSGELFVFHGHQTSRWYEKHNNIVRLILRYLANPLHITNYTVAANSRKRFRTERRVYDFATRHKVAAVIGHTHRPLFESMSKSDSLQFEIERLCRKYPKSKHPAKIEDRIAWLKEELIELQTEVSEKPEPASLYREHLLVPSMFNSGCVLGKRGMTSLEIERGFFRLVYWYDTRRKQKYLQYRTKNAEPVEGTPYHRVVIKEDSLDYIFSRIQLLA